VEGITLAALVYLAAFISSMAGIYGVMTARSIVKLLISIEILFNSIVLTASYIGVVSGADPGFYSLLLATIVLTIAEIAIVAAILILVYRKKRSLSTDLLSEIKG